MLRKLRLEDCESQDSLGLQSEVLRRKGWKEGLRGKERDRRWEKERKSGGRALEVPVCARQMLYQ